MKKVFVFVLLLALTAGVASAGEWVYDYWQDQTNYGRCLAVKAEDDVAADIRSGTPQIEWYHNAKQPLPPDCFDGTWNCPFHVGESIAVNNPWGVGIDGNYNVYVANRDDSNSVLVWDDECNEVDRFETGSAGTRYLTACDVDANGYVYVAWYIEPTGHQQVEVYNPMPWGDDGNHHEDPVTGFDGGAFVTEGICVNSAGTVVWQTNRGGWVKRFTGSPLAGYTEDIGFSLSIPADVRGIDVDETYDGGGGGGRIFVISDRGDATDRVTIANATTGAVIETLYTRDAGAWHAPPYDVEYEPVGKGLYICFSSTKYWDKWHEEPPTAVTMSSFEAIGAEEQVELTWRVESEADNAGFKIYRDGDEIAFVEGQGNSDAPRTYTWVDKDLTAGVTYTYKIANVDLDGKETMHDFVATATPKASDGVPTTYALAQNYPNPFNADTHIEFTLAKAGHTTLKIYNTTGQLVRTLVDGQMDARIHKVRWNGRNEYGAMVSSGIYFYRLASGNFAETKKMSFLR